MQSRINSQIDWTGVMPDDSRIAPLDAESFVSRLQLLSDRVRSIEILRQALLQSHIEGDRID